MCQGEASAADGNENKRYDGRMYCLCGTCAGRRRFPADTMVVKTKILDGNSGGLNFALACYDVNYTGAYNNREPVYAIRWHILNTIQLKRLRVTQYRQMDTHTYTKSNINENVALPSSVLENPNLMKYWKKRFSLFSKFDKGIKMDEESWYSVTPEVLARHTAHRCACNVIIDAFCGAGGNTIQFAKYCRRVIAIDIDPNKIEIARNNAMVYGVESKITFIVGDFMKIGHTLQADVVFLSPPWGGPEYLSALPYNLETMLQPAPLSEMLAVCRRITYDVALFLPRNSDTFGFQLAVDIGSEIEVERNFLNMKEVAITVFYNRLVQWGRW